MSCVFLSDVLEVNQARFCDSLLEWPDDAVDQVDLVKIVSDAMIS